MTVHFNYPHQYYKSLLNRESKSVYNVILNGIKVFEREIAIQPISISEMSKVWENLLLDNPLLFYVRSYVQMVDSKRMVVSVKPNYMLSSEEVKNHADMLSKFLLRFVKIKATTEIEKALYLHDYCLSNFKYDYSFGTNAYSALGLILGDTAVCEGIAKFTKLAFDFLGMKSMVVTGTLKNPVNDSYESHAWNIVEIDTKVYHLDVTLDMTLTDKRNRYDYFNLSDYDIKKDHVVMNKIPLCKTIGSDYFSQNKLALTSSDALRKFIHKQLKEGDKHLYFKLCFEPEKKDVESFVLDIAKQQYSRLFWHGFSIELRGNGNQLVYELEFKQQ